MIRLCAFATAAAVFLGSVGQAAVIPFGATLTGSQETPPNNSPGTGTGSVLLDDVADTITVDLSWANLTTPATAAHIHTAPPGVPGPITFPLSGVPFATTGSIPEQVFSITPAQIVDLEAGNMYLNVHSTMFPDGEIRGQLGRIPEPGSLALIAVGLVGLASVTRLGRSAGWRKRGVEPFLARPRKTP